MKYYATKRHSSIARTERHALKGKTLLSAKREASRLYSDDFEDHEIMIIDEAHTTIAYKLVGSRGWITLR